jgi:hypothetical protein
MDIGSFSFAIFSHGSHRKATTKMRLTCWPGVKKSRRGEKTAAASEDR